MAFKKISHDGVIYDVDIQGGGGTGAVNSVNGKQGDVVLTGADIKTNTGATLNAAIAGKQNALTEEEKQAIADLHQDAVTSVNGQIGAVTVPASEPYDDTEIRNEIAGLNRELTDLDLRKMEYAILNFTGSAFQLDGQTLTFAQIKDLCLNAKDFVYAQYSNRLYIPQYVSNSNIFFEASYIQSDVPQMHRIAINSANQVSQYNYDIAKKTEIPTALPTPNALTFSGGATGTFDGSEPLSINIPTGGGGGSEEWEFIEEHIVTAEEESANSVAYFFQNGRKYRKIYALIDESAIEGTTYSSLRMGASSNRYGYPYQSLFNTTPIFKTNHKFKSFLLEILNTSDGFCSYVAGSTLQLFGYLDNNSGFGRGYFQASQITEVTILGLAWLGTLKANTKITCYGVRM